MFHSCCVPECDSRRKDIRLHRVPIEREKKRRWLKCFNSLDLMHYNSNLLYVCHKHFEKRFITASTRLTFKAYPTLFTASEIASGVSTSISLETENVKTPSDHDYSRKQHSDHLYALPVPTENTSDDDEDARERDFEPTSKVCKSRKLAIKPTPAAHPEKLDALALRVKLEHEDSDTEPHCTEELVYDEAIEEHVTVPLADEFKDANEIDFNHPQNFNRPPTKLTKTTLPLRVAKRCKLDNQKQVVHPTAQLPQSDSTASLTNLLLHDIAHKQLLLDLEHCKKENLKLRKELSTLRKRNKILEKRLANFKRTVSDKKAMFDKLTANMSAPAKAFFEMQFQSKKKNKGRRYSLPGRIIALSIYKASPACYAMLSKYFVLPSMTILKSFVASVKKPTVAIETNVASNPNEPETEEDHDMFLANEDKMDGIEDLDLNDYNINNTFQEETSEAVDNIANQTQAIKKEPQISQATEDMHQMIHDTSELQNVELYEGQAIQLADGRIFQLIDGQIVEVVSELKQEEVNVSYDETRGTGLNNEFNLTVNDVQSMQEYDQGAIVKDPLRRYGPRDELPLLSVTPLPQDNASSTQQIIIDHHQQSHRVTSSRSMIIKPNSFDGRPANVNELYISNPLRSQVGEQATQIKHPHRTQQHRTKHKQATKETSSFSDMSRMVTPPVTNLKRVATDKEPLTSLTSAAQMTRVQKRHRKRLKTKKTTIRGPDMPDLTFS